MSKPLLWREEWLINIEVLDRDHRALIEALGDICLRFCPEASSWRSGDANALVDALTELREQVREHFEREETFMRSIGYADLAEHQREHLLLMAEFTALLREWRGDGVDVFDESRQENVRHWLLTHILGADREFAHAYFELCGQSPTDSQSSKSHHPGFIRNSKH